MDKQVPQGDQIAGSALFKKFLGKAEEYLKKPTRVKQLLNDAYQKASEKNDVGSIAHEAWETLQTLFRLIRAAVSGEYTGLPTTTVVAAVAVTIYFLSPIDLIPDFIPVLGLLDDVALVAWFSTTIKEELDKFSEWEKTRASLVPATGVSLATVSGPGAQPASTPVRATDPVEAPSPTQPTPSAHPTLSNTDSGLGSPTSSNPAPSLTTDTDPAPKTDVKPYADRAANTTDSSRYGSGAADGGGDPGGNVR